MSVRMEVECIFCKEKVNPRVPRIYGGGRLSCCRSCLERLERGGMLAVENGKVRLKKSLLDVLTF
jgi:hypothetical protein